MKPNSPLQPHGKIHFTEKYALQSVSQSSHLSSCIHSYSLRKWFEYIYLRCLFMGVTPQFRLAFRFETRYEYDYDLTDLVDGGEGETYSYNLWHGVQQVISSAECS